MRNIALAALAALAACGPSPQPIITADTPWGPTALVRACDALDGIDRMECLIEPRSPATAAARRFQATIRRDIYVMAVSSNWSMGGLHPEDALAEIEAAAMRDEARDACDATGRLIGDTVRLHRVGAVPCPP
jgi:hypothetical protein